MGVRREARVISVLDSISRASGVHRHRDIPQVSCPSNDSLCARPRRPWLWKRRRDGRFVENEICRAHPSAESRYGRQNGRDGFSVSQWMERLYREFLRDAHASNDSGIRRRQS